MGQCESCVNTSKTAKGNNSISYGQGKKRHTKAGGSTNNSSRRNSMASTSNYGKLGLALGFHLLVLLMRQRRRNKQLNSQSY